MEKFKIGGTGGRKMSEYWIKVFITVSSVSIVLIVLGGAAYISWSGLI